MPPREQLVRITNIRRAVFGWTILVIVVVMAAAHIGWPLLRRAVSFAQQFEQHVILTPASQRYRSITVHRLVDPRETSSDIRLVLKTLDDREHELRYTVDGRVTTSVSGSPKVFNTRDNATIVHLWLKDANVVMHEEVLRLELQQLIDWLDDARKLGDAPISVTKFTRYWVDPRKVQVTSIPPDPRMWVVLGLMLLGTPVVWCVGLIAIIRANRRVLAHADGPTMASNARTQPQ